MSAWVDVQLAAMGYLTGPEGHSKHVPGLHVIARDTLRAGVRVRWALPPGHRRACCYLWRREIVLHPGLFCAAGDLLREAWAHELGHALVGPSEARVHLWEMQRYGDLLTPIWASG